VLINIKNKLITVVIIFQNYYKPLIFNHNEHSPPEAAVEATPETTPIRVNTFKIICYIY